MECNRDEAKRAKEIAERKFSSKDIHGARKFALKAQSLYPELDGIVQLLVTLDVYIAAEKRINGELDLYGILGLNPLADEDTVRRHYRKLALSLHPDKNKSIGAEGAFKHVSEAWSLLSDKGKRSLYDQKRNTKVFTQKTQTQNGGSPAAPSCGQNGFYNFTKSTTTRTKGATSTPKDDVNAATKTGPSSVPNTNATTKTAPSSTPSNKQTTSRTFWTVCHGCKMQYEYLRMYLYQNLLCPNCHEPFLAIETPPPNTKFKVSKSSKVAGKNVSNPGRNKTTSQKVETGDLGDSSKDTSFHWGPFSKTTTPASSAQAASMVQRAYERVKREREEAQAATKREEALRRRKNSKKAANLLSSGLLGSGRRKHGVDDFAANKETGPVNASASSGLKVGNPWQAGLTKDVPSFDIRLGLMEKARIEIQKKLGEWSSKTVEKSMFGGEESAKESADRREKEKLDVLVDGESKKDSIEPLHIDVPDPDFHDFDRDRTERCFGEGQVWAAYDDDDGMPRYYAKIRKVISFDPFKMKICWLNLKTNNELGPSSGISKACGDFRAGRHEVVSVPNFFSHKVNLTVGTSGSIHVYPRKGDVWALYRNWSSEWNDQTPNEVIHQYEIVEVDEHEGAGIVVTPLVKVAGFKTLFHRHLNPKEARTIPENEIFRFSHQIPSYLHTGQESPRAPKGCCELDPAATPSEFLQVIADAEEAENIEDDDEVRQIYM